MSTSAQQLTTSEYGEIEISIEEHGQGSPFLLLHGGGGPQTISGFARLLADQHAIHAYTPTHPGFAGTPRPESLSSPAGLADVYAALLDSLELSDVTVIGNSIGGWIAAELTLCVPGRIASAVLVDAAGIDVEGHPVADIFTLSPAELAALAYHEPARFAIDPATMPDQQRTAMAANRAALAIYNASDTSIGDPTLHERLAQISTPTLVVWGASDRVVDPDYGRAYAAAIPGAKFELIPATGHLPQIEAPEQLLARVWPFANRHIRANGPD